MSLELVSGGRGRGSAGRSEGRSGTEAEEVSEEGRWWAQRVRRMKDVVAAEEVLSRLALVDDDRAWCNSFEGEAGRGVGAERVGGALSGG